MAGVVDIRIHARIGTRADSLSDQYGATAVGLSVLAALAGLAAAAASLLFGDVLRGPAAMNGSLQGTALVLIVITLPTLAVSMALAARGSTVALVGWLGALTSIAYQGVLFAYATPFNSFFFLYVALLSLSTWGLVALSSRTSVRDVAAAIGPGGPIRLVAAYLVLSAGAFALLWLRATVPAVFSREPPEFLLGTGMTTGVGQVLDLGFTLPIMVVAAYLLLRRRPLGYVLTGTLLVMLGIENVSIGVDQWLGALADPSSPVVSAALVPVFAVMSAIGIGVLVAFLRGHPRATRDRRSSST
jgi:hypothetical protein